MSARGPGTALLRAIMADAAAADLTLVDATIETEDWASATFVGHRHRLAFTLADGCPGAWLAHLPDAEWRLPGHLVADVAVERHDRARIVLAALTLREL